MEESGENWPSDSPLGGGDGVIYEEGEFECDDDEGNYFSETETKGKLSEGIMALSATIPGLKKKKKKMDDTRILEKASKYMKKLQKRVRELEQKVESNKATTSAEVNSGYILPEIKARVLKNEVLVIVHCEKENGVMLKILTHLENLHLSIVNSSVMRFGESTLDITIIAQMGDGYNTTLDELVKSLRIAIST